MTMKRKLCSEELEAKKNEKVIRLSETIVEMSDIGNMEAVKEERKLNFKLTDKKAKSNLLKGASREHLEVESKQKSKNIRFSTGSLHVCCDMNSARVTLEDGVANHPLEDPTVNISCEVCNFKANYESDLLKHSQIHLIKFKCTRCEYEVKNDAELTTHVNQEHKAPTLCSDVCNHETHDKNDMDSHVQIHVTRLKCDKCEHEVNEADELSIHKAK